LLAGEEVDMPLLFFIDKDILDDPACRGIDDVVLSYTFFRCVSPCYPKNSLTSNTDHIEPVVTLKVILSQMQVTKTFRILLGSGITRWHRVQKSELRNQERANDI
jgi:hypothetical protein